MEFWGVEVKSGEPLLVKPGDDYVIHLSQACLGEVKKDKGSESIYLYVEVDGQKLVIGRLSGEKFPQLSFDLVFDKEFQLSHNWKNGSVHFCGYKSYPPGSDSEDEEDVDDLEGYEFPEALPVTAGNNGNPDSQAKPIEEKASSSKPDSATGKQKVKIAESKKKIESSTDDDSDDKDSDSEDQVMANGESDDEDESENNESSDEDEETPKMKVELSKKRPVDSSPKSPPPEKKAKFVTPQKSDAKKGVVHVATPHPSKHAIKPSTSNEQTKQQAPSPSASIPCKSCNRTFKSDQALQSHTKAKHSAAA